MSLSNVYTAEQAREDFSLRNEESAEKMWNKIKTAAKNGCRSVSIDRYIEPLPTDFKDRLKQAGYTVYDPYDDSGRSVLYSTNVKVSW